MAQQLHRVARVASGDRVNPGGDTHHVLDVAEHAAHEVLGLGLRQRCQAKGRTEPAQDVACERIAGVRFDGQGDDHAPPRDFVSEHSQEGCRRFVDLLDVVHREHQSVLPRQTQEPITQSCLNVTALGQNFRVALLSQLRQQVADDRALLHAHRYGVCRQIRQQLTGEQRGDSVVPSRGVARRDACDDRSRAFRFRHAGVERPRASGARIAFDDQRHPLAVEQRVDASARPRDECLAIDQARCREIGARDPVVSIQLEAADRAQALHDFARGSRSRVALERNQLDDQP
jgi:hypothetical protein